MTKILIQMWLLMLFSSLISSQNEFVELRGTVTSFDFRDTSYIKNAEIVIKINDTIIFKLPTNELGTYSVKLKRMTGSIKINVEVTKNTKSNLKRQCGFLNSKDVRIINDLSIKDIYIADFSLTPISDCMPPPPSFLFKHNTSDLFWAEKYRRKQSDMPPDSALLYITSILVDYPSIVLELNGHCDSKELNSEILSIERAQLVKDELLKLGIAADRLKISGHGSRLMLYTDKQIKRAKTKDERCELRQMNRRVTFRILSF